MTGWKKMTSAALSAALLVSGLSFAGPVAASTQDDLQAAQAKKSAAESEYQNAEDRINDLQTKKDNAVEYLQSLNDQLTELNDQLDDLQAQFSDTQEKYDDVSQELADAKSQEATQAQSMKLRIQYIYESGNDNGLLGALLSSDNFTDFLNASTNVSELEKYDRKILKEYAQTCETVKNKQEEVQKEAEQISALQEQSKSKREEIQELVDATRQDVDNYAASLEGEQSSAADLLESIQKQQENIDALNQKAADEVAAADAAAAQETRTSTQTAIAQEQAKSSGSDNAGSGSAASSSSASSGSTAASTTGSSASSASSASSSTSTSSGSSSSGSSAAAAATPTPTPTQAPTPAESTATSDSSSSSASYSGAVLTAAAGRIQGPSGAETYYNMDMSGVVSIMRSMGNTDEYWVRSDGVKMLGSYVMVAANLSVRPRGSLVATSLGTGIVVDTGGFAVANPYQLDIATNW
ncbi:MAG: coiled-coil domain-containing protein [Bilifractor sp.]